MCIAKYRYYCLYLWISVYLFRLLTYFSPFFKKPKLKYIFLMPIISVGYSDGFFFFTLDFPFSGFLAEMLFAFGTHRHLFTQKPPLLPLLFSWLLSLLSPAPHPPSVLLYNDSDYTECTKDGWEFLCYTIALISFLSLLCADYAKYRWKIQLDWISIFFKNTSVGGRGEVKWLKIWDDEQPRATR